MDFKGILIGAISFLSIGLFHPIVIKAEYYFSYKCWPAFCVIGILFLGGSVLTEGMVSCVLAVIGFSCMWSILELFHQKQRVEKGWFPENPNRKK